MASTRRRFIAGAVSSALAVRGMMAQSGEAVLLAGTGQSGPGKGIYSFRFDARTGVLTAMGLAAAVDSPTFLAVSPDRRFVYAISEIENFEGKKSGSVTSLRAERGGVELKAVNRVTTVGAEPVHVATDAAGGCVFVTNYDGGSVVSYTVRADGGLSEAVSFFKFSGRGPDPRQDQSYAHRVTVSPDQRFLLVTDRGLDGVHIFALDAKTAKLTAHEPAMWKASPGTGPRMLRFHPNGRWAYCLTELKSTLNVLHWDAQRGAFERVQEISMVPDGYVGEIDAAELVIDASGRFAYASSRRNEFLATFAISPVDGKVTLVERSSCGGKEPRHIALDATGRWLLVANQYSDYITVFARDMKTGKLAGVGKNYSVVAPECLVWV